MSETYNAAERQHVKAAARAAKVIDLQKRHFITEIMSTAPGRTWVYELLERGHVFGTSFTGEALGSAFREGERNAALQVLNDIMTACPDHYVTMTREANARRTATDAARKPATEPDSTGGTTEVSGDDADDDARTDDIYTEYEREVATQSEAR